MKKIAFAAALAIAATATASAQVARLPYGAPITLEQAKVVVAAAEAEAEKNNWTVSIAIVDSGCNLVLLHKRDSANIGGIKVAQEKAMSACLYRGATKNAEDAVAKGGAGIRMLALTGMVPLEGGLVLTGGGATIGAIGVSGAQSNEDGQIAAAGVAALGTN